MDLLLKFMLLAAIGITVIIAAFWDYAPPEERKARSRVKRGTSTTMTSGKTGYVIITYERDTEE
jgi:hypothetical protein